MFNANNYGYNPYGTYLPQRPMVQPIQTQQEVFNGVQSRPILNGKQVDSIDVVKATDIPMDGSVSYFPLTDGSAIVTKQLQNDGTSKITIFKPFTEENEEIRYITREDMEKALEKVDLSELDDIKDDIRELRQEFKDFKKKKKED